MTPINWSLYPVIGVDTAPIIYTFEEHSDYTPVMRELLQHVARRKSVMVTSIITFSELLVKPFKDNNQQLVELYEEFLFQTPGIAVKALSKKIAKQAAQYRADYNLKTPDAIQLATAVQHGCKLFLTNDHQLKRVTDIRVITLTDLMTPDTDASKNPQTD